MLSGKEGGLAPALPFTLELVKCLSPPALSGAAKSGGKPTFLT